VITQTRVSTLCFPRIKLVICGKYLQNSDPVRGSLVRWWSFKQGLTFGVVGAQIDHNTLAGDYVTGAANWRRLGRGGVASGCPRTTERGSGPATQRGRGTKAGTRGARTEKLSKEDSGWRRGAVADADCRAEGSPDCSWRTPLSVSTHARHTTELGNDAVVLLCPAPSHTTARRPAAERRFDAEKCSFASHSRARCTVTAACWATGLMLCCLLGLVEWWG
jgi:hypothetical protein